MRLTCPACCAEMSLEAAIGREADARALAGFIERNLPLGGLLVRYIACFRPAKRRLSMARTVALFDELLPDLQRQAITRKGRDWAAPEALWRAGIEQVLAARDKGTLTLPLTSHGYLLEVMVAQADKAEGLAERERETDRAQAGRSRTHKAAPAAVANLIDAPAAAPLPPPYDISKGPSRYALRAKAEAQAKLAARQGTTDQTEGIKP